MKIGSIDVGKQVVIVAEIGNNHEGNIHLAHDLVKAAADTGVDAVKFQTFRAEHYISARDETRFQRLKSFELTPIQFRELSEFAHTLNLLFISTPFDLGSADVLSPLVDAFKIASGDNNFYPLIERVARTVKPIMVSTGLADDAQVARTLSCIRKYRRLSQTALLHCVTAYPVEVADAQLRTICRLAENEEVTVGYSDHTLGVEASVLSVALGARIIEKHFTLDKHYSVFHDHQISADPPEMLELVQRVRRAEALLGTGGNAVQPAEQTLMPVVRRSIVAGRNLQTGHVVEFSDLTWIRLAEGLPPGKEDVLVGKQLNRDVCFGEKLTVEDVG